MLSAFRITYLTNHGVSVDLAHVGSHVLVGDPADDEVPRAVVVVGHVDPWVVGDHVGVDRLNRLRVCLHPPHLSRSG